MMYSAVDYPRFSLIEWPSKLPQSPRSEVGVFPFHHQWFALSKLLFINLLIYLFKVGIVHINKHRCKYARL